jgi:hypothetical protein
MSPFCLIAASLNNRFSTKRLTSRETSLILANPWTARGEQTRGEVDVSNEIESREAIQRSGSIHVQNVSKWMEIYVGIKWGKWVWLTSGPATASDNSGPVWGRRRREQLRNRSRNLQMHFRTQNQTIIDLKYSGINWNVTLNGINRSQRATGSSFESRWKETRFPALRAMKFKMEHKIGGSRYILNVLRLYDDIRSTTVLRLCEQQNQTPMQEIDLRCLVWFLIPRKWNRATLSEPIHEHNWERRTVLNRATRPNLHATFLFPPRPDFTRWVRTYAAWVPMSFFHI